MTLVLIEMCHRCSTIELCYDHVCDKCLSEQDYFTISRDEND